MMTICIIELGGVAFFSYIMGNFIDIVSNYSAKMGRLDRSDELTDWLISLERFTTKGQTNIPPSLIEQIIYHQNYGWKRDRLGFLKEVDNTFT
tara:strand:+ start:1184 stop:1462 length:279 start_codon:yes stop_codon:yes gene_type:complete